MTLGFPKLINDGLIPVDNYFIPSSLPSSNSDDFNSPIAPFFFLPISIPTYCKIIEIGFNVIIPGILITDRAKVGIYEYNLGNSNPGNLIKAGDSEIDFQVSGYRFTIANIDLDPGIYYIGVKFDGDPGGIGTFATIRTSVGAINNIIPLSTGIQISKNIHKYTDVNLSVWKYSDPMENPAPGPFLNSQFVFIFVVFLKVRSR